MPEATFVTLASPGEVARQALLLGRSIRDFGGVLSTGPIWALVPDGGPRMARSVAAEFEELNVRLIPFPIDPEVRAIPFAVKAVAGARAESLTTAERLVWLDPDALVVGDASELLIPDWASLGYRPVHHRLIGPDWDAPLDAFWRRIFDACHVSEDRFFRMTTNVGEHTKPYINAGVFVVRPERRLLRHWLEALVPLAADPDITAHYREDRRYEVFLHQAVWTGVVLHHLDRTEMAELSPAVNYPFNLHDEIPARSRAISLASLTAIRTEGLLTEPDWPERLPVLAPLAEWLAANGYPPATSR